MWATEGCRKRAHRAARPDKARTGSRPPTRYAIFKRTLRGLSRLGRTVEAHDRESAIREVAGAPAWRRNQFVAIPERMLRSYSNDGTPV